MISIYNLTFSILKSKIAPNVIIGIYSITHINLKFKSYIYLLIMKKMNNNHYICRQRIQQWKI